MSGAPDGYRNCEVTETTDNTKQKIILITQDKIENLLLKNLNKINAGYKWIEGAALFLTIFLTYLTADFKSRFGIEKETWQSLSGIASFAAFGWFIWTIIKSFRSITIEKFIERIKIDGNANG